MADVRVDELVDGVHRVTHRLPFALDHVHTYAVAGADGWTIVDAGLALGARERWREALAELGDPHVRRIVVTHYHPDHIGGAVALAELTGAEEILQGRDDARAAREVYGEGYGEAFRDFLVLHGMPADQVAQVVAGDRSLLVAAPEPTRELDEGDTVVVGDAEHVVLRLPGHADGHVALYEERTGRLLGGDVLLEGITPNVATLPHSEPDPLGRYLDTLRRLAELAPSLVLSGHHRSVAEPAARAREIERHHGARLDETEAALHAGARSAYEVAARIWGTDLSVHELRFALAESVSHLVRLDALGRSVEDEPGRWRAV